MRKFQIIADSTCDLGKDLRTQYDIDYVKMNYIIDGEEFTASLDWENHSSHDFYDIMRKGKRVRTTQVSREEFTSRFSYWLGQDTDILYISCSSALSGSINLGQVIAKELTPEYPGSKIVCIDSLCSSLGQGMMAIMASELRAQGKSLEETADFIESNKLKVNQCGTVESLNYLRQAGRVTASSAFFGNIFAVKPIIVSDRIGQNYAVRKVKGTRNAMKEIAADMAAYSENPSGQCLYLSHADALSQVELLRDEILRSVPFGSVYINTIGPIVGASVGPGTVIAFCYGKEVTVEGKE